MPACYSNNSTAIPTTNRLFYELRKQGQTVHMSAMIYKKREKTREIVKYIKIEYQTIRQTEKHKKK